MKEQDGIQVPSLVRLSNIAARAHGLESEQELEGEMESQETVSERDSHRAVSLLTTYSIPDLSTRAMLFQNLEETMDNVQELCVLSHYSKA